tara:strand:- start:2725 stop:3018 length:294 start_codon:yes stop_codon:yes gene_type:complete
METNESNYITNAIKTEYYNPFIKKKQEECVSETLYMVQSQTRIIIKSILYRLIALAATISITYYYTRNYAKSFGIGIMIELLQTVLYYTYEQLWNNI